MISKKMQDRLLEQVKAEWESEFYYLAMMAWCFNNNFPGFGKWLLKQADEERGHGMKLLRYLSEVGGDLAIPSVTVPKARFESPAQIFDLVLKHERKVTALIHGLVEAAQQEKDYATLNFLQWYVKEQVEEESTAADIVARLERVKGQGAGLMFIENQLAARE